MPVCLSQTSSCFFFFLFLDGIELFFGRQFSMTPSTKRCSSIFDLLPKICIKSPISRLVWHIDRRCFHLPGGFRGWPIQWNHAKCCGAAPCCHGNKIWARRRDLDAYWLVDYLVYSTDPTVRRHVIGQQRETRSYCHAYFHSNNNVVWCWSCHSILWILRNISLIFRRRNKGIESHDNDIDMSGISKTMFDKRLFIHRIEYAASFATGLWPGFLTCQQMICLPFHCLSFILHFIFV